MRRILNIAFSLAIGVQTVAAQSSVTGTTINAPLGQVFYGQIATFKICNGQAISAIYAEVNWGDGTLITGAEIPDPLYQGRLLGSHSYASASTFSIGIKLVATCFRDAGDLHERWKDFATGTATAIVPLEISTSSIKLSPGSIVRGGTVTATVTIAGSAPSWGTLVQLGSSDPSTASVAPGVLVQASGNTATFTVTAKPFSGAARNVTITAVSGGAASSAMLAVK